MKENPGRCTSWR